MTNSSSKSISSEPNKKQKPDSNLHSEKGFEQAIAEKEDVSLSASFTQSTPLKTTAYQLPEPSMRIRYGVHWFRIGFSIFLLLSMILSLVGCSLNAATVNWKKAVDVVSTPVLEQVIRDNTELNTKAAAENILVWDVGVKDGNFRLFNFNTPEVCGALGCLYAGYWFKQNQLTQVFLSYLNPSLPPGKQLSFVGETTNQSLPCIKVLQAEKQQLRQLNYCFNGNRYQVADSQLLATMNKSAK
ncbi:hypothetical protein A0J48_013375 [Sphaerospermopsis aphanizomenoides BCCUSP55]|uniref:hypothetical protein n=1 Tax=Sphaerospermopsis aphanizomenoides TaxID=459663 RepID=UPI001902D9C9|nr:hypothetical protein [Sphaerospermopsis aphanizomenoides]MBK1988516.1 hypothetical protein [Sphaerospermopsis aphanizomenoides BCCUSP55]